MIFKTILTFSLIKIAKRIGFLKFNELSNLVMIISDMWYSGGQVFFFINLFNLEILIRDSH